MLITASSNYFGEIFRMLSPKIMKRISRLLQYPKKSIGVHKVQPFKSVPIAFLAHFLKVTGYSLLINYS